MRAARVGGRLRRFREQRGLTQSALATALGISPSYVNQIESNQRPITVPVLLRLAEAFDIDPRTFSDDDADRTAAGLYEALRDPSLGVEVSLAEARDLAAASPTISTALLELHRRYRYAVEANEALSAHLEPGPAANPAGTTATAYEAVRDLFYDHHNYIAELDAAAEAIAAEIGIDGSGSAAGRVDAAALLSTRLAQRHATAVEDLPLEDAASSKRRYDPARRVLSVSPMLDAGQRAFQLGTHLAFVELAQQIDDVVANANLADADTRGLARIGLANYAAGAMLMPYRRFRAAAEELRYDLELLGRRFAVGYETVAHRLSTLQRPRQRGVPFIFVRVDRAGNISKRQSATAFHFSRVGGSCPLWVIHEAFATPGQIRTQLAQMPDGRAYLWVVRTATSGLGGYHTTDRTLAVGLGCDLVHASRLVYADGLDLTNPNALVPIGPGCKVCDRRNCPQRAFPAYGTPLAVDPDHGSLTPYAMGTS